MLTSHIPLSVFTGFLLIGSSFMMIVGVVEANGVDSPLPSCDSVDVFTRFNCTSACAAINENRREFRDVNGKSRCSCTNTKICNDSPTCAELLVTPGFAQSGCEAACPNGVVSVEDNVRYAGDPTSANMDATNFVISCTCNGQELCEDVNLFSDLVELEECTDRNLATADECNTYCNSFGTLFTGSDFKSSDGLANCACTSDEGEATACQDTSSAGRLFYYSVLAQSLSLAALVMVGNIGL